MHSDEDGAAGHDVQRKAHRLRSAHLLPSFRTVGAAASRLKCSAFGMTSMKDQMRIPAWEVSHQTVTCARASARRASGPR